MEDRPCEDMARRWPSTSQEEGPQEKSALDLGLSLHNCEKTHFCYLHHLIYGYFGRVA